MSEHAPPAAAPPTPPRAPSPPRAVPDAAAELRRTLGGLVRALRSGKEVIEESPLFVLGSGPVPVDGAGGAAVALDREGNAVMILALASFSAASPGEIADQLDRIAQLSRTELEMLGGGESASVDLSTRHAVYFRLYSDARRPPINREQKAVLLVAQEPSDEQWRALLVELGPRLGGVYLASRGRLRRLSTPAELLRREEPADRRRLADALPIAIVVVGLTLTLLGVSGAFRPDEGPGREQTGVRLAALQPRIARVALGTPPDATNNHSIGQQRVVRTSSGALVAVYPGPDGLRTVSDNVNQGRSWQEPITLPQVGASSFSVAIDDNDDLHLAMATGPGVSYGILRRARRGWRAGQVLRLDRTTDSPVVDLAWDAERKVTHVIWVKRTRRGQQPHWAAIASDDGGPSILQTRALAPAGADARVLANIAVGPGSRVLATYRRAGSKNGWFSRTATADAQARAWSWDREQAVIDNAPVGAATLVVDGRGLGHLVLRDDAASDLKYFTTDGGAWSEAEIAVDGASNQEIDFPSLSVDNSSGLVYLFLQSTQLRTSADVLVALRDPSTGWEGPYRTARGGEVAGGARYPSSLPETGGHALVLWTTSGQTPAIQAARVTG